MRNICRNNTRTTATASMISNNWPALPANLPARKIFCRNWQAASAISIAETDEAASKDTEQIRLSTIHQAKGLEFDVVFLIMLCDGLFPAARSLDSAEGEEEERRLLYVAITRARNELCLSYPLIRLLPGSSGDAMQLPSRFLGEIPKELLEEWNLKPYHPYG